MCMLLRFSDHFIDTIGQCFNSAPSRTHVPRRLDEADTALRIFFPHRVRFSYWLLGKVAVAYDDKCNSMRCRIRSAGTGSAPLRLFPQALLNCLRGRPSVCLFLCDNTHSPLLSLAFFQVALLKWSVCNTMSMCASNEYLCVLHMRDTEHYPLHAFPICPSVIRPTRCGLIITQQRGNTVNCIIGSRN